MKRQAHHIDTVGAHKLHRRTDKAQTLMRGALKKPASLSARIQHLTPGLNPEREIRAKKSIKHSRVDRFGNPISTEPKHTPAKQVLQGEVINPHSGHVSYNPNTPSGSTSVTMPSMVASASHQKLERLLDEALTKADAHKQAMRYQAARHFWQRPGFFGKHRGLKLSVIFLALLVAAGFFAWHKMPQLSVKLAAAKTHINASVPSYKPTGYALASPATTQAGAVILKYKAPDSNQGFEISQKPSNMTSASVAQTVVPKGTQVQTSQVGGNTVYIYGQNNDAAWVNNGVLYTIKDRSKLSSDQIIKIVQGLN